MTSGLEKNHPTIILHWKPMIHQTFWNAITIAREYHKPGLYTNFTCNPQWPESAHSLLSSQPPQDRPESKFHLLLYKLYDKSVALAETLLFISMIDVGMSHLYQHHLHLFLLVPKMPNGSKMPNLHTVCLCSTVFHLKYANHVDRKTNHILAIDQAT